MKRIYCLILTTIVILTSVSCTKKEPKNTFIKTITISNLPENYLHNIDYVEFSLEVTQNYDFDYDEFGDLIFYDEQEFEVLKCPTTITFNCATPIDKNEKTYFSFMILLRLMVILIIGKNLK